MDAGDDRRIDELFGAGSESIRRYVDILVDRGIAWGLLGPREGERLWERHVLNSVALASLIPVGASVVDVGSGAGLPGVPLAILRPDLSVTLLDSLARRCDFLTLAVDELLLGERVRVVRARAEEHSGQYGVVTGRAVAPLAKLAGWCAPLLAPGGRILALKGSSASEELIRDRVAIRGLGLAAAVRELEVPVAGGSTWVVDLWRDRRH